MRLRALEQRLQEVQEFALRDPGKEPCRQRARWVQRQEADPAGVSGGQHRAGQRAPGKREPGRAMQGLRH